MGAQAQVLQRDLQVEVPNIRRQAPSAHAAPRAPRGPLTAGQASIVAVRRSNGSRSSQSFASMEAARARAQRDEEEPWIGRYIAAMQVGGSSADARALRRRRSESSLSQPSLQSRDRITDNSNMSSPSLQ